MNRLVLITIISVSALCAAPTAARADWDPGDPSKYEQLPDLNGWDIAASSSIVGDDFLCTETGYITKVHFWGSWKGDDVGVISNIRIRFWRNDPGTAEGFSHPSTPAWEADFGPSQFTVRPCGTGNQGWYDPVSGAFTPDNERPDHVNVYQFNIDMSNLALLFRQEGTAAAPQWYWLLIEVTLVNEEQFDFGWKTALEQHFDDAVYDAASEWPPDWHELVDPRFATAPVSLDLAFVLEGVAVPEPSVLVAAGLGLLGVLGLRRRK